MPTSNVAEAYGFVRSSDAVALPDVEIIVALASADPLDKPFIDPRYLSDAGGEDRAVMMAGLAIAERILATPSTRLRVRSSRSTDSRTRSTTPRARRVWDRIPLRRWMASCAYAGCRGFASRTPQ